MTSFTHVFEGQSWDHIKHRLEAVTSQQVERTLQSKKITIDDFLVLVSSAALPYLDIIIGRAHLLTQQRFGKTIQMYAPMYLSNECNNICTYCGYSFDNKVRRRTLTDAEIITEAHAIKEMGFDHLLLVTGEANATVHLPYFLNAIKLLKPIFANISMEVQPLETHEYQALHEAGVYSILVYQETYDKAVYKTVHPKGKKSNFSYRLETPERIGISGIHKTGLGVLLGLSDWRVDSYFCALHLVYLQKKFWQQKFSISFPRIRPAEGVNLTTHHMSDKELLQLIAAYRLLNPDVELSISTRETEVFRNTVIQFGATSMSAASKTNPGGYKVDPLSLEQFEIEDQRTAQEFAQVIKNAGYDPVWKDWDHAYSQPC